MCSTNTDCRDLHVQICLQGPAAMDGDIYRPSKLEIYSYKTTRRRLRLILTSLKVTSYY